MLRVAFRSVPMPQWKELVQRISATFGFGGEVSEVTASIPEETDEPFRIAYKYTRKEYADWPNRRILAPAPVIGLPSPPEDGQTFTVPLLLGAPTDIDLQGRIQLPKGYTPSVPEAIHLKTDFAEYDATYSFKDGSLISDRHYRSLTLEVPQKSSAEYKKFNKAVVDDYITYIPLFSGTKPVKSDVIAAASSVMRLIGTLPDSSNKEALRLEAEAMDAGSRKDVHGAISSLYRAVAADPKFTRAWIMLGGLLMSSHQNDAGRDAFQKAISVDPKQPLVY